MNPSPSLYKAPFTELQPSRKSFLVATDEGAKKVDQEKKKEGDDDDEDEISSKGIFSQTVHAFAEAFTAHGVHYIFERGQNVGSRLFWVVIVIIAFVCSCLMLESAYRGWIDNPILTSVKSTGLNIKDIEHPAIIICGQGSNLKTPIAAMYQLALDFQNATHSSGAKMEILEHFNPKEFEQFVENYLTPYLDKYFPLKNDQAFYELGFTMIEMIRLIASKNPEARIRAQVAREGGYDPCATSAVTNANETESGSSSSAQVTYSCPSGYVKNSQSSYCYQTVESEYNGYCEDKEDAETVTFQTDAEVDGFIQLIRQGNLSMENNLFTLYAWRNERNRFAFRGGYLSIEEMGFTKLKVIDDSEEFLCIGAYLPKAPNPGDPEDILYLRTYDCEEDDVISVCQKYNIENVVCNAQSKKRRRREIEDDGKKENNDVNFDEFYDTLDFMLNPNLANTYERGYNLLSKAYKDAFGKIDLDSWYQGVFKTLWGSHLV